MDQKSKERLRFDRRLIRRRGHMSPQELERALEGLPDVASKSVAIRVEEPARQETREPEKR